MRERLVLLLNDPSAGSVALLHSDYEIQGNTGKT